MLDILSILSGVGVRCSPRLIILYIDLFVQEATMVNETRLRPSSAEEQRVAFSLKHEHEGDAP